MLRTRRTKRQAQTAGDVTVHSPLRQTYKAKRTLSSLTATNSSSKKSKRSSTDSGYGSVDISDTSPSPQQQGSSQSLDCGSSGKRKRQQEPGAYHSTFYGDTVRIVSTVAHDSDLSPIDSDSSKNDSGDLTCYESDPSDSPTNASARSAAAVTTTTTTTTTTTKAGNLSSLSTTRLQGSSAAGSAAKSLPPRPAAQVRASLQVRLHGRGPATSRRKRNLPVSPLSASSARYQQQQQQQGRQPLTTLSNIPSRDQQKDKNKQQQLQQPQSHPLTGTNSQQRYSDDLESALEAAQSQLQDPLRYSDTYMDSMLESMKSAEGAFIPRPDLLGEITPRMWAILMDWLIEVQINFSLVPETLYLAVNMVNRFVGQMEVSREELQLVGAAALLLASKHEEIFPPEVADFEYICAGTYKKKEILDMEMLILDELDFKLCAPTSLQFLSIYARISRTDSVTLLLARYFLELTLQEYPFRVCPASFIAAGAFDFARRCRGLPGWGPLLQAKTGYTLDQVRNIGTLLNKVARLPPTSLQMCRKKYSMGRYGSVSSIVIPAVYAAEDSDGITAPSLSS